MWNYSFLFPSIIVLLTLLCYYFSRPKLSTRRNRTYFSMLILELWVIFFDIISSVADENHSSFSPSVLYMLNTIFFVLYLTRIYGFFRYSEEVLKIYDIRRRYIFSIPYIVSVVVAISCFATGAVFSIVDGAYQSGKYYDILFYCYLLYILASLVNLLIHHEQLNLSQLRAYLGFNMMLMIGTLIRKLYPRLLVMNTFSLVALLIIYLSFENPDLFLSERGSAFNMRGFRTMLDEVVHKKDYYILGFVIKNYVYERSMYGSEQTDLGIAQINLYLRMSFPSCRAFYLRNGRFALMGSSRLNWEKIREQVKNRFHQQWNAKEGGVYVSIGFAEIKPQPNLDSTDRIINNLSIALETVGHPDATAPHNLIIDADKIQHLDEQVDILRTLEKAVHDKSVEVFFQPVFDSHTRTIVAAEALARIRDEDGKIMPPNLFIPVAEKNGHIDRLGEIVFEKTCAFIHDYDMETMGLQWINVNLSPIQCMQSNLTSRLTEILKKYQVPAEKIHLELTEQSIIDYSLLEEQITGLKKANFQFVLDDYGSGYSNLTRVRHYPFVNIKLDMEVVWDYNRERDTLLPDIVKAFRQLGFSITAEGIETQEMADALTDIGCDYLQGYLFDKPLPIDVFMAKYRM